MSNFLPTSASKYCPDSHRLDLERDADLLQLLAQDLARLDQHRHLRFDKVVRVNPPPTPASFMSCLAFARSGPPLWAFTPVAQMLGSGVGSAVTTWLPK